MFYHSNTLHHTWSRKVFALVLIWTHDHECVKTGVRQMWTWIRTYDGEPCTFLILEQHKWCVFSLVCRAILHGIQLWGIFLLRADHQNLRAGLQQWVSTHPLTKLSVGAHDLKMILSESMLLFAVCLALSAVIGTVGGVILVMSWWRFGSVMACIIVVGLMLGFVIASTVLFTPLGRKTPVF